MKLGVKKTDLTVYDKRHTILEKDWDEMCNLPEQGKQKLKGRIPGSS